MIFLSIKAWEVKSLPKSLLGWFLLVFGKGKTTKEKNINFFVQLTFTFRASVYGSLPKYVASAAGVLNFY